jgi:hypothetical protein
MNILTKILVQIGNELSNQISFAKNTDEKINTKKLLQQSEIINRLFVLKFQKKIN